MIEVIRERKEGSYQWIDITAPTKEELIEVANGYGLPPSQVEDCLQPEHLPKLELIGDNAFVILRAFTETASEEDDTIQEVTDKIIMFIGKDFLISIHRPAFRFLSAIKSEANLPDGFSKYSSPHHVLVEVFSRVITTFDAPLAKLAQAIDLYEPQVFLQKKTPDLLKDLYYIKRRATVIDNVLDMSKPGHKGLKGKISTAQYNHIKDEFLRLQTMARQVVDNVTNLLNIYISISAQRTNEVMRVLTIFSVFFMPLTFIAGIYGMNFDVMPELRWDYGYAFSVALMVSVTLSIYLWFRRKEWL